MDYCSCQKASDGHMGWDRSMVDPGCPLHGHEALPEHADALTMALAQVPRRRGVGPNGQRGLAAVDALIADGWQLERSDGASDSRWWSLTRDRHGTTHTVVVTESPDASAIQTKERMAEPKGREAVSPDDLNEATG